MIALTADLVATAIVAACRETGEDPVACCEGRKGIRARHYVMHALAELFPPRLGFPEDRARLGRVCGVRWGAGNDYVPYNYFSTSLNQVFRPYVDAFKPERSMPHWAAWFSDEAYDRVRASLRLSANTPTVRRETKLIETVTLRRDPVAPELCENQVGELMGDPSPGRSALADYVEREARKALDKEYF